MPGAGVRMLESRLSRLIFFYCVALFQGMCITLAPASNFIYKSASAHGITDQQYGFMFLPMVIASVWVNLRFRPILHRLKTANTYLTGLIAHFPLVIFWMCLSFTERSNGASFAMLLISNIFLGAGFGILITVLNLCVVELYPEKRDMFLAGLHAVVGVGASLSPWIIHFCLHHGHWVLTGFFYLAVASAILLLSLTTSVIRIELTEDPAVRKEIPAPLQPLPLEARFFILAIFLYGTIEASLGNWSTIFLMDVKGFRPETASLALSLFWFFITVGRVLTTLYAVKGDARKPYRLAPWVILAGLTALTFYGRESLTAPIFILIGLGCSCFFPLTVSFITKKYDGMRDRLAAYTIVGLMSGVGAGSLLPGILRDLKWMELNQFFIADMACAGAIIAILLYLMPFGRRSAA